MTREVCTGDVSSPRSHFPTGLACALLFLVALAVRLPDLDAFVTWDEPAWAYRAAHYLRAWQTGDFWLTRPTGHPGVITMMAGATGLALETLAHPERAPAIAAVGDMAAFTPQDPAALAQMTDLLAVAKPPLAMLNAFLVALVFLFAAPLLGRPAACLGTLLLALDPFFLAHSRVLHLDALTSLLMILSLLALWRSQWSPAEAPSQGQTTHPQHWLILSGLLAGLAILNRSSSIYLIGFTGLLLVLPTARQLPAFIPYPSSFVLRLPSSVLRPFILWSLAAGVTLLIWPAVWLDPVGTFRFVFLTAGKFVETAHASGFFLGEALQGRNPGPLFYPVVTLFRLSPVLLIGLILALGFLLADYLTRRPEPVGHSPKQAAMESYPAATATAERTLLVLLAYGLIFAAIMTMGAKKFDRYLLPLWPAFALVAAWGWSRLGGWWMPDGRGQQTTHGTQKRTDYRIRKTEYTLRTILLSATGYLLPATGYLLPVLLAGLPLSLHPYYLSYFNPLLGGTAAARYMVPVGWGEGVDQAVRYINQLPASETTETTGWALAGLAGRMRGEASLLSPASLIRADYVVLYIGDVQFESPLTTSFLQGAPPLHTVRINGLDYAYVYQNTTGDDLLAAVQREARPDDLILTTTRSRLTKGYIGPARLVTLPPGLTDPETVAFLNQEAAGRRRLLLADYPELPDRPGQWARALLDAQAFALQTLSFEHSQLTVYALPEGIAFRSPPANRPLDINFGNRLTLAAYGLVSDQIEARQTLLLRFHWLATGPVEQDYTLFAQLFDDSGYRWAQVDRQLSDPAGLTTSAWKAGDRVETSLSLSLPLGLLPGTYTVRLGLYRSDTTTPLPRLDHAGAEAGLDLPLTTVTVLPATYPATANEVKIANRRDDELGNGLTLIGVELPASPVRGGEPAPILLAWQGRGDTADFAVRAQVRDDSGALWGEATLLPGGPAYPTSRWRPGEALLGRYLIPISPDAPETDATLTLQLLDTSGAPAGPAVTVGRLRLARGRSHQLSAPTVPLPQATQFGAAIRFLGYDLSPRPPLHPGGTLTVTLYWHALNRPDKDYKVFVHLLDGAGKVVAQQDAPPLQGSAPTSLWLTGEYLVDPYRLDLPATLPAGDYRLEIGLYEPATSLRLAQPDGQDHLILSSWVKIE